VPADAVATVMVLQSLDGLSDRDAARALADRISRKVAAGLALDDTGIHYSVLTYWRSRLRASDRPERIFDTVLEVITETGVLAGNGVGRWTRRCSTTRSIQDTVTQLVSAIRRVRRVVPAAAAVSVNAHDYDASAKCHPASSPPGATIRQCNRASSHN
jgi:IS5 family transposase